MASSVGDYGDFKQRFNSKLQMAIYHLTSFACILQKNDSTFSTFSKLLPELESHSRSMTTCYEECKDLVENLLSNVNDELSFLMDNHHKNERKLTVLRDEFTHLNSLIAGIERATADLRMKYVNEQVEEYSDVKRERDDLVKQIDVYNERLYDAVKAKQITSLIPFVALLGVPISHVFQKFYEIKLDNLQYQKCNVESKITECLDELASTRYKLEELNKNKAKNERKKRAVEQEIQTILTKVNLLKEERNKNIELSSLLKSACKFANEVHGKALVLRTETIGGYSVGPLMRPLKELTGTTVKMISKDFCDIPSEECKMVKTVQSNLETYPQELLQIRSSRYCTLCCCKRFAPF